jgi:uncharacterized protein YbjT (DUF2867 family)
MKRMKSKLLTAFVALALALLASCASPPARARDPLAGQLIVVAGASGRAGSYLTPRLKEEGLRFRALTRDAAEARKRLGSDSQGVEWVEADVRDPAQVARALAGADYVVSVVGSREMSGPNSAEFVDYAGVKNLVDAARKEKVRHFVLLSAIGASDPQSAANKLFKGALQWRFKGEEYLRASGLGYTIVRPAGLTNGAAGEQGVKLYQGDDWKQHLRKTISRDDLALVLIESMRDPRARDATFEIANDAAEPPGTWPAQMRKLLADR